ncbi:MULTISPECIES: OmpH family outer membrane protein [unclassified Flavobacterium]|uniref:OmpH family outer membrane protein n=1 Tax=unclassified Flavobacterium TaxID=196869 RepID=UPI001F12D8E0|nr:MULTISPECIES: OmpH family outer membrane protein [unclassified Flavobacterium]UMY66731.1 OmpH family outer membrane protein [Flavobacterium sp. HJ-32-4]
MNRHLFALLFLLAMAVPGKAQSARGIRVGYIDMNYILQNVSDYAEALNQLEQKAQKWKQEADTKKNEIARLKDVLKTERPLLTKELIEEREEEITFLETELADFQQKKFGPTGELVSQKAVLVQPIQDQVFNAVQDIAEARKYDFIFDKSSDLTMLFAAKRFDISDQVIRVLNRAANRSQKSKKELKEDQIREYNEDLKDANPNQEERQKQLEERKAAREKQVADRKAAAEAKRAETLAKRQQAVDERNAARKAATTGKPSATTSKDSTTTKTDPAARKEAAAEARTSLAEKQAAKRDSIAQARKAAQQAALDKRNKTLEERKKALEERKAKADADKKAKQEKTDAKKEDDPAAKPEESDAPATPKP